MTEKHPNEPSKVRAAVSGPYQICANYVDDLLAGGNDGRHIELVLLDGRRDGLEQIAEALAGRSGTDAIHLITHGSQAALQLGTARLTTDSMLGAYADALSEIGLALAEGGDILIYGCHFGQGALGRQAAGRLATLAGADVAASDDLTGAQTLGGDWELEVHTGDVETAIAFSTEVQQDWFGVLPDPWWNAQWLNRATITFDNQASGAPLTDFPVLVSLNTTNIPSLDLSAVVGADVRFIDQITGAQLKYEVEGWDDVAETATVWVKVPQIDATNSDFIWVYYNYNGAATYDQNAADEQAVWDSNYAAVWHLDDSGNGTAGEFDDSNGTNDGQGGSGDSNATPTRIAAGQVGGAQQFDGGDYINLGMQSFGSTLGGAKTYEWWVDTTSTVKSAVLGAFSSDTNVALAVNLKPGSWELGVYTRDSDFNAYLPHEQLGTITDLTDGSWHHIAMVIQPGTNDAQDYYDGTSLNIDEQAQETPSNF